MCMRSLNMLEELCKRDPKLLRYASAITEQNKCWELLAQHFDWFQTLRNNSQHHATTYNRMCKRTQHVTSNNVGSCWPTMLRPFARGFKFDSHLSTCPWPQQCWKSCANGSNIVALRFGDHGTKEMLGVVGWKVWPVSSLAQQLPTTCNRVCKRTQHVTSSNVGSCWPTTLCPLARGFSYFPCF